MLLAGWCFAVWRLSAERDPASYVGIHLQLPDKVQHLIEYTAGGFLACGVANPSWKVRPFLAAVAFCAAWGALDEVHQGSVPGRDASGMDLAADVVGASLGAAAFLVRPWRRRGAADRTRGR